MKPILEMTLGVVGKNIDLDLQTGQWYRDVRVTGVRYEREAVYEAALLAEKPRVEIGRISAFIITTTTGEIFADTGATWRYHE